MVGHAARRYETTVVSSHHAKQVPHPHLALVSNKVQPATPTYCQPRSPIIQWYWSHIHMACVPKAVILTIWLKGQVYRVKSRLITHECGNNHVVNGSAVNCQLNQVSRKLSFDRFCEYAQRLF